MKVSFVVCALVLSAYALPNVENLASRQNKPDSLLIDPKGLSKLPSAEEAKAAAAAADLPLDNIQGDILAGMKKNNQLFFFFKINDKATFKSSLKQIHPMVTNTNQLLASQDGSGTALNVAFSQSGLNALDVTDDLGDQQFKDGQFANLGALGDPGSTNWVDAFKDTQNRIHGVFLLAAATEEGLSGLKSNITSLLGASASELYSLKAAARPGDQLGHEHFGFLDGVSQPGVIGFTKNPHPGQSNTSAGIFLLGEDSDPKKTVRPAWTKDGSFLAFRQLKQLVPEFNDFVNQNALNVPGLTAQENADLFGARIVGRWKSGAPIDLSPLRDDPALGADADRNNNFTFAHPGKDLTTDQTNCPFSAHIRKTRPRADLPDGIHQILRSGIPYGPEVTDEENQQKKSGGSPDLERGLAFVSYQSVIANGFQFIQQAWVDNPNFRHPGTGQDPLIGSANTANSAGDTPRNVSGLDPQDPSRVVTIMKDFVVSRGGEYFFSPSLSAILDPIAA